MYVLVVDIVEVVLEIVDKIKSNGDKVKVYVVDIVSE